MVFRRKREDLPGRIRIFPEFNSIARQKRRDNLCFLPCRQKTYLWPQVDLVRQMDWDSIGPKINYLDQDNKNQKTPEN